MTITLRGWKAVAAAGAFFALVAAHQVFIRRRLDAKAIDGLKPLVKSALVREVLQEQGNRPWDQMTDADKRALSDAAVASGEMEILFENVSARGFGDRLVVRADVTLKGNPAYAGTRTRYFLTKYSLIFGWIYYYEVGPLSYWFAPW